MKHPRASELTKLVQAVEKTGARVSAVEVRWEIIEGRETQVWRIVVGGEEKPAREPIQW